MAKTRVKSVQRKRKAAQATTSPLLRSALEVLEHGLYHYFRSETAKDMRFAIMHIDQAVELLLKERVRVSGRSIYKTPKETISMLGAYSIIENELKRTIPEKMDLELLHEKRNNIQHKSGNPSPEDASFLVNSGVRFAIRFCEEDLGVNIAEYVPNEYLAEFK